ncbi:MAG: NERD domain-containing protein [Caldilineaceae bacterium]|nr:NERD domain-containing protein [Caldilineaceae bacterium]MBP8106567.1 NERD domain-containing protein [Caldilineaceae bacterium]MBP9071376.1 NERD domain-containing protein [Caldilineaceae bacterium]
MARLIPKIDPNTIQNPGERIVAKALVEQLPSTCVVYHSYPWLRPERHDKTGQDVLRPGEADFVIVDPEQGVLVLEVKGGEIAYDPQTHEWFRTRNNKDFKDPFVQVARNKYALEDRIEAHSTFSGSGKLEITIGYAVVFPDCRYAGTFPAHISPEILIDADAMRDMKKAISRAYNAWCPVSRDRVKTIHQYELDAIFESLSPVFQLTPVLWRTIEDQEERIKRLTNDQSRLLEMLRNQDRAAIAGVAGSGKTILALAQAQRFARAGLRTLLVCYNRLLADWLVQQVPTQYQQLITVINYHRLVREMCRITKLPFHASSFDQDFWDFESPELLEQAASMVSDAQLFQAIVVDEGQDFRELWWIGIEKLFQKAAIKPSFYVFYDPKQVIYQSNISLPAGLGNPFELPTNCRNTREIAAFCAEIVDIPLAVHEDAPVGIKPGFIECHRSADVVGVTQKIVQDWCLRERGGLAFNQVAILVPSAKTVTWPEKFGNIPLVTDQQAWRDGKGILVETHRRFKGLEADAIVLAGIPVPGGNEFYSQADHYVASSRAKHMLEIVRIS